MTIYHAQDKVALLTEKLEGFGVNVAALLESLAVDGMRLNINDEVLKVELCIYNSFCWRCSQMNRMEVTARADEKPRKIPCWYWQFLSINQVADFFHLPI